MLCLQCLFNFDLFKVIRRTVIGKLSVFVRGSTRVAALTCRLC